MKFNSNRKKYTSLILVILFGPFGMFYWGIKVGLAALLGTALFVLVTTYLNYSVNLWYQLLIRIVFLIINIKILGMTEQDLENLRTLDLKAFIYLIGMVILNFIFFGFIGFVIWSIFKHFIG
jgi:hypothetical protein